MNILLNAKKPISVPKQNTGDLHNMQAPVQCSPPLHWMSSHREYEDLRYYVLC